MYILIFFFTLIHSNFYIYIHLDAYLDAYLDAHLDAHLDAFYLLCTFSTVVSLLLTHRPVLRFSLGT